MARKRSYGTGSIYKDKDGGYRAQIRVTDPLTGKSKPVRRRAKTRDEARALLADLQQTTPAPKPEGTLAAYLADWVERRLPALPLSDETKTTYRDAINWWAIPAAGNVRLSAFDPRTAEAWLAKVTSTRKRNGEPLAPASVRKTYNAVVKALDLAVRDGLIASNPLRRVDPPKVTRPAVAVADADHTAAAIEATKGTRVGRLVVTIAYTGMRLGEALGLQWKDVDLARGTATIRRSGPTTQQTKTGKARTVTLLPVVVEAMKEAKSQQRLERLAAGETWTEGGWVFTNPLGAPIDAHSARRALVRALEREGLDTARPFHAFRHGLATRLMREGVPMPVVSAILGHSGIQITVDTYGHLDAAIPADVLARALGQGE